MASLFLAVVTLLIHFLLPAFSKETILRFNYEINAMELGGLFDFGDGINRIYFRSSILFIVPFLYNLGLVIRKEDAKRKLKFLPYLWMSVSMCAIIITYTRSIWLGALVAFLGFAIFNFEHFKVIIKAIGFSVLGVLVFILLSWAVYGFEGVAYNAVSRLTPSYEEKAMECSQSEYEFAQRSLFVESDSNREKRLAALSEDIKQNWLWAVALATS